MEIASAGDLAHSNSHSPAPTLAPPSTRRLLFGLLVLGALVRALGLRRIVVEGPSMLPTLAEGERLLVRRVRRVRTGDLVVCRAPGADGPMIVKRVAHRDGAALFVVGDNPGASSDSRAFGTIAPAAVLGVAFYRYAPDGARLPRGPWRRAVGRA